MATLTIPEHAVADEAPAPQAFANARGGRLWINLAVATAGLSLLIVAFAAYLFGFSGLVAYRSQRLLAQQLGGSAGLVALNGRTPAEGQPVAILAIPSLGLKRIVVEGTSSQDLQAGPGLLIGSAPPGTAGNVVIAGRRSTYGSPFADLGELRPGATVEVTAALGRFDYLVKTERTVSTGQPLPASPTSRPLLTLVTSSGGLSPDGLVVVTAGLVGKPVARVPLKSAATPVASFGLGGDGSAIAPTLLWGAALLFVLASAWLLARRSGRLWLVYGLAIPIVTALALLVFSDVAALLPATL
jgi:sortase A